MNCSKIQNLLSAYMDGELTGEEQLLIRRHLGECEACAEEHESLLTTKRMIACLSIRQPSENLEHLILGALAEEDAHSKRRSPLMAWWLTLPLNRRLQFASVFAACALGLAAIRIVPVLLAQQKPQSSTQFFVQVAPPAAFEREPSPAAIASFLANPVNNAPMTSGGAHAVPVNMTEYAGPR